jgi:O-acetyl-ADP-ribose deacetylase (regulator of RNase III)
VPPAWWAELNGREVAVAARALYFARLSESGVATIYEEAFAERYDWPQKGGHCRPLADPCLRLWRGDITTLAADAIVNAANSQMLGCWVPGHFCIDNAIHSYAGVQLRAECARVMAAQGHEEATGLAKVTAAYNLPAQHVIHTVGPIADGHPTDLHRRQLASCYESCLDLAGSLGLRSLAFCCISTGVFGFPQREAAQIAVRTVRAWLDGADAGMTVVFNVFGDEDERIYQELLGTPKR